ncbi:hypothetical protein N0V82_007023 [Gnomoniopsis sp. IMI 355080]|nr:hypothetical protein N0V82_007023 [Gnomoniopsis sp. IMI 355080]
MHFLCPTCAPKYANMMANLFNAPKPQKQTKQSEPKASEETAAYSTSAPKMGEVHMDLTQSQSKGAGATIDKKDGPQP